MTIRGTAWSVLVAIGAIASAGVSLHGIYQGYAVDFWQNSVLTGAYCLFPLLCFPGVSAYATRAPGSLASGSSRVRLLGRLLRAQLENVRGTRLLRQRRLDGALDAENPHGSRVLRCRSHFIHRRRNRRPPLTPSAESSELKAESWKLSRQPH